jgi:hypothetical protein
MVETSICAAYDRPLFKDIPCTSSQPAKLFTLSQNYSGESVTGTITALEYGPGIGSASAGAARVKGSFVCFLLHGYHALDFEITGAAVAFRDAECFDPQAIVHHRKRRGIVEPELDSGSIGVENNRIHNRWLLIVRRISIDQRGQHRAFAAAIGIPGSCSLEVCDSLAYWNRNLSSPAAAFPPCVEHGFRSNIPMRVVHLIYGLVHKTCPHRSVHRTYLSRARQLSCKRHHDRNRTHNSLHGPPPDFFCFASSPTATRYG